MDVTPTVIEPASAGNATTHGLTARKGLPAELQVRTEYFRREFIRSLHPLKPLEHFLIDEMARHAAAMEFCGHAEPSILQYCACQLPTAIGLSLESEQQELGAAFVAALANEAIDRVGRYRRQHERGFYSALARLQEIKIQPIEVEPSAPERFPDEQACESYLRERLEAGRWQCPHCGDDRRHWLRTRSRSECGGCKAQVGLRAGTVMQGSPIPLVVWFRAILAVADNTQISPRALADKISISRLATVATMLERIREATESDDREQLLAGLDSRGESRAPAPSVIFHGHFAKPKPR